MHKPFVKVLLLKMKQVTCSGLVSLLRVRLSASANIYQSLGSLELFMLLPLFYFREALKILLSCTSKSVIASQRGRNRSWQASARLLFPDDLCQQ